MFHVKRRPAPDVAAALARYRAQIERYHATLDLMSPAGLADLDRHLADARAYADLAADLDPAPRRALDLGSGVGLPGVVLAASVEDLPVELVERRAKRATFLRLAVAAVGADAQVVVGDVRRTAGPPVDLVTAQAVAPFADVYALVRHRLAPDAVLMARKGDAWRAEVDALAEAADGASVEVVAERPASGRGILLAVRVRGGGG
ncbi:MAG: RsmG family class I SAM-dependent methyltransferase [Trueperaceae bacterium]|nr:RsmG family class I SAM-dependent methyltransferase [Trueperaceae bacterium]